MSMLTYMSMALKVVGGTEGCQTGQAGHLARIHPGRTVERGTEGRVGERKIQAAFGCMTAEP